MRTRLKSARAILAVAAVLIGIGGIVVPGPSPVGASGPVCGSGTLMKTKTVAWVCTFDDEFNGTSINRSLWTVQQTSDIGYRAAHACLVDTSRTVSVSSGALNLTVYRVPAPFRCATQHGSFATAWYGGSVFTKAFDQAYGRIAVRAKFPEANGIRGLQSAIWTFPRKMSPHNVLAGTTEIDIAEAYSQRPNYVNPTVHHLARVNTQHCLVTDYGAGFHTYEVIWTPQQATFYYDGVACYSSGGTATAVPFLIALTQGLGIRTNLYSAATPSPATMKVDWVRVWK